MIDVLHVHADLIFSSSLQMYLQQTIGMISLDFFVMRHCFFAAVVKGTGMYFKGFAFSQPRRDGTCSLADIAFNDSGVGSVKNFV